MVSHLPYTIRFIGMFGKIEMVLYENAVLFDDILYDRDDVVVEKVKQKFIPYFKKIVFKNDEAIDSFYDCNFHPENEEDIEVFENYFGEEFWVHEDKNEFYL